MATKKKVVKKTFAVTAKFDNVQISVEVPAESLEEALTKARELKFDNFISAKGNVFDFDGPVVTSLWEN